MIGPNGAGKSTFFKMLTGEVPPSSGQIFFQGREITGQSATDVCQSGVSKSYQINQLFAKLTVRENLLISALGRDARPLPPRHAARHGPCARPRTRTSSAPWRWST